MKSLIDKWKEGWVVLGRLFLFGLILNIIFLPLHLLKIFMPEQEAHAIFDKNGFHPEDLLILFGILLVMPLGLYFASRISGEFVAPRRWKKKDE
jgi:hypothetical protein